MGKMVRMSVANRNAAGLYLPVPKPTANGTLNSIAEIGAAPVTPTKMTPHRPIAFGLSRSTPDSATEKDSTVPGWVTPIGCVFAMRSLVSLLGRTKLSDKLRALNQFGDPGGKGHMTWTEAPTNVGAAGAERARTTIRARSTLKRS